MNSFGLRWVSKRKKSDNYTPVSNCALTSQEMITQLLELVVIFLKRVYLRGIKFRKPGTIYYAKFMVHLIYRSKIFFFT